MGIANNAASTLAAIEEIRGLLRRARSAAHVLDIDVGSGKDERSCGVTGRIYGAWKHQYDAVDGIDAAVDQLHELSMTIISNAAYGAKPATADNVALL